jgi:ferredoxin-type protein NapG
MLFTSELGGNVATDNVFEGNLTHVAQAGRNSGGLNEWRGNHWDDYQGFDRDGDNVGDTPYELYAYADRIWMEIPQARFFKTSPALELLDFLERLAPFSTPDLMLKDEKPRFRKQERKAIMSEDENRTLRPPAEAKPAARAKPPLSRAKRQELRRKFLRTVLLTGGVLGAGLSGFLPLVYARTPRLRPPGALDEKDFLASCIKCGQCVQVCPVDAIKLADLVDGFGVGAPYIDAREQACDFSCDAVQCILACPTGSLTYTSRRSSSARPGAQLAAKPILLAKENDPEPTLNLTERMGVARLTRPESAWRSRARASRARRAGHTFRGKMRYMRIDRWKPVPIAEVRYDVEECDLCVRECPIKGAISIETVYAPDGSLRKSPVVHEPCVGCGVCEMICPTEPGSIEIAPLAPPEGGVENHECNCRLLRKRIPF